MTRRTRAASHRTRLSTLLVAAVVAAVVAPVAAFATHSFVDVPDDHTFHDDIEWLKGAGVTTGCNPPANTE